MKTERFEEFRFELNASLFHVEAWMGSYFETTLKLSYCIISDPSYYIDCGQCFDTIYYFGFRFSFVFQKAGTCDFSDSKEDR